MSYTAPLERIRFALEVAGLDALAATGAYADLSDDLVAAVLEEAGKLAGEVWAPLNKTGDGEGSALVDGAVLSPKGFAEAYRAFAEGGWAGLAAPVAFGGQAMPQLLDIAASEMWSGANMALSLCPMLSRGAIAGIRAHGTEAQKLLFLPKLVTGEWTGTMLLTEAQAGSDVGALRTKAVRQPDGSYRLTGTKIFITWGEHDIARNIAHLVLARLPDAPLGTKGISLFLMPKFMVGPDGTLGPRNDLRCLRLEEKLGIHASPTCVMSLGENEGAYATLIGEENRGMACMFTMMNDARLNVGVQGLGVAEAAYQKALAYAQERRQGRLAGQVASDSVAIIAHPDVQRMLATMRALAETSRALCYATAQALDLAHAAPAADGRRAAQARADLLTPVAKSYCTDAGVQAASLGLQVHGGMGFIEETGAAQFYRDARIAPIYEGTNGIQAIDLVTRKLTLEDGAAAAAFLTEIAQTAAALKAGGPALSGAGAALAAAHEDLGVATAYLQEKLKTGLTDALSGATPYLTLFANVAGGHFLGRGALLAARAGGGEGRAALLRFWAQNMLSATGGLRSAVTAGAGDLEALSF